MRTLITGSLFALALSLAPATLPTAHAQIAIRVGIAPPQPRVEVMTVAPSPRHVWQPGYWGWRGGQHFWYGGTWAVPPQQGMIWQPHRWVNIGGQWEYQPGRWVPAGGAVVYQQPQPVYQQPQPVYQPPPQPVYQPPQPVYQQPQEVVVQQAPPPEQVEVIPVAPAPDYVWIKGHWTWDGRWVWLPGRYEQRRAGWQWMPARYENRGRGWGFRPGHWRPM